MRLKKKKPFNEIEDEIAKLASSNHHQFGGSSVCVLQVCIYKCYSKLGY